MNQNALFARTTYYIHAYHIEICVRSERGAQNWLKCVLHSVFGLGFLAHFYFPITVTTNN